MTRPLDEMIGRLDRLLSEFLIAAASDLDEADRQTIKHHADDLIGVGRAAIKKIQGEKGVAHEEVRIVGENRPQGRLAAGAGHDEPQPQDAVTAGAPAVVDFPAGALAPIGCGR